MQKSGRRARFGWWFLLIWAAAVLALMLVHVLKPEEQPRFDGAMLVHMEAGCAHV